MKLICRLLVAALLLAYVFALIGLGAGMFGWFGVEADPLAAVGLVILGQPWVRWVDLLPSGAWVIGTAAAPLINVGILLLLCRTRTTRG